MAQQLVKISQPASEHIKDLNKELFLSDVSVMEMVIKHSAGKLPLRKSPRKFISEKTSHHQVSRLGLVPEVIYRRGELPRCHVAPFDRLLAAEAIEGGMTLLSPDTPFSFLGAYQIW